jgi:Pyridoxamine 5'-phosphate oxidase
VSEPDELLAPVRAYLEARCAVLSTVRSNGAPHQSVVHYLLEDAAILVNGRPKRRWAVNLREDPDDYRNLERVRFLIRPARVFEYG